MRVLAHFLAFVFLAMAAMPSFGLADEPAITSLKVEAKAGGVEEITFTTDGALRVHRLFTLQNPDRVVIDVPLAATRGAALPGDYKGGLITALRTGRFDSGTTRLVFEVAAPTAAKLIKQEEGAFVVRLAASEKLGANSPFAAMQEPTQKVEEATETKVIPESQKPLVVIDAGHGGQDPGAIGKASGVHEKTITLAYARALKEALLRTGRYRVALTRDDDRFIKLGERVNIARGLNADLFLSLHADSNPNKEAYGISFYSLSETASDAESAALAEQENKADIIPGLDLGVADEDVASILIDLTQRETMNKSSLLADNLVAALHPKITKLPKVHRYAGFRVLKAPDIPSVLVELGFLSNPKDEKLLQSPEYRGLVAASLVKGIDRFFDKE